MKHFRDLLNENRKFMGTILQFPCPEIVEILKEGSAVAEKTAAATLANVRKAMRIDYFADNNLLK